MSENEELLARRIVILENAFDRLERATCGIADLTELRRHFGLSAVDQILIARNDRVRQGDPAHD